MDSWDDGGFTHDELDATIIAYIHAAEFDKDVIRILSDDTDVFVILVYWVLKRQLNCSVQMERWNGVDMDINTACTELSPKCLQLLGVHTRSGCYSVPYPFRKGKMIECTDCF